MSTKNSERSRIEKEEKTFMARISRRDFMKKSLMFTAGFATVGSGMLCLGQAAPKIAKSDAEVLVAIASSNDKKLGNLRAPLDAPLRYEQVDATVRRALSMDTSPRALKNQIKNTDWVVIKPNIVTSRSNKNCSYWYNGIAHPGQETDLRVIKSLIGYIVENCPPKRITIAEGGAEWKKTGASGTDPNQTEDGWTVKWPEYDNLSYVDIVEEYNKRYPGLVDIVDLNYDTYRFLPVPDPKGSGIGTMQRVDAKARDASLFGREVYVPGTGALRDGYHIPETILACDILISVPAMKTHVCGTTLAMKNYIGILPNHPSGIVKKSDIHNGDFQKGFIDLFSYHPADYSLLEGFYSTEGNGPQWGETIRHNVVIATADPVAADTVGSTMMGFNPLDIDYLYYAAEKGFGTFDSDDITIVENQIESVLRKFSRTSKGGGTGFITRGNRSWLVKDNSQKQADWKLFSSEERYIDFARAFEGLPSSIAKGQSPTSASAAVEVYSKHSQKGQLWAGADGKIEIRLNNEKVLSTEGSAGHRLAEHKIDITLKEGANRLLVTEERSERGFGFTTLLCNEFGDGLFDVSYRIS